MKMQVWFFSREVLFTILLLSFISNSVYSDIISSNENMAIGKIKIDCENEKIITKGFLSKIYKIENNTIKLFDIKPSYKTGEVNCEILDAKIYNYKGEELKIQINKLKNKNHIWIFLIALIFVFILFKKSKNY